MALAESFELPAKTSLSQNSRRSSHLQASTVSPLTWIGKMMVAARHSTDGSTGGGGYRSNEMVKIGQYGQRNHRGAAQLSF